MTTFTLYQRKESGELIGKLTRELSEAQMLVELAEIVQGHGPAALEHYAVTPSDGFRDLTAKEFLMRADDVPPTARLVPVSGSLVISELIKDFEVRDRSAVEYYALNQLQETVRTVLRVVSDLGFVIAKEEQR